MASSKAIPDRLRTLIRRFLGGANWILPREGAPPISQRELDEAQSQAHQERARRLIEHYQTTQFNPRVDAIAGRLARGDIQRTVARALMLIEIRALLVTGAVAAAGGFAHLDADDRTRIETGVREQAGYLDNWLAQIERTPTQRRSEAQLQARARLYGGSGGRIVDETIDQSVFREYPTLPFYAKQKTICRSNCACGWLWTNVDRVKGDADVHWKINYIRTVGASEHCLTCLLRASTFNPLMIRNWEFTNLPSDLSPYMTDR